MCVAKITINYIEKHQQEGINKLLLEDYLTKYLELHGPKTFKVEKVRSLYF